MWMNRAHLIGIWDIMMNKLEIGATIQMQGDNYGSIICVSEGQRFTVDPFGRINKHLAPERTEQARITCPEGCTLLPGTPCEHGYQARVVVVMDGD